MCFDGLIEILTYLQAGKVIRRRTSLLKSLGFPQPWMLWCMFRSGMMSNINRPIVITTSWQKCVFFFWLLKCVFLRIILVSRSCSYCLFITFPLFDFSFILSDFYLSFFPFSYFFPLFAIITQFYFFNLKWYCSILSTKKEIEPEKILHSLYLYIYWIFIDKVTRRPRNLCKLYLLLVSSIYIRVQYIQRMYIISYWCRDTTDYVTQSIISFLYTKTH